MKTNHIHQQPGIQHKPPYFRQPHNMQSHSHPTAHLTKADEHGNQHILSTPTCISDSLLTIICKQNSFALISVTLTINQLILFAHGTPVHIACFFCMVKTAATTIYDLSRLMNNGKRILTTTANGQFCILSTYTLPITSTVSAAETIAFTIKALFTPNVVMSSDNSISIVQHSFNLDFSICLFVRVKEHIKQEELFIKHRKLEGGLIYGADCTEGKMDETAQH